MRGGIRKGSGRKVMTEEARRVQISCTVAPTTAEVIRRLADDVGISSGRVIDEVVEAYIRQCNNDCY